MKQPSQHFSPMRFTLTLKRDLALNGRAMLLRLLLMLAVTTTLLLFIAWPSPYNPQYYSSNQSHYVFNAFRVCGSIFAILGASLFMENMKTPGQRLNTLMFPATTFEKFLSRFCICIIGVLLAYLLCFTIADGIRVLVVSANFPNLSGIEFVGPFNGMRHAENPLWLWGFFFCGQACYALGATVSPKNSFLKTTAFLFLFAVSLSTVTSIIMKHYILAAPEGHIYMTHGTLGEVVMERFLEIAPFVIAVACYVIAYFRMRESEVINRL